MLRKTLKVLKWTGIVIVSLFAILLVAMEVQLRKKFDAPYPSIKASTDSILIDRGRQLVTGPAHCVNCHGPKNADSLLKAGLNVPLHGGYAFELPFGNIYARNITPDNETGIGKRTDAELARVLRYGVHANGRPVLDFMPFHDMSDEDLTAVISYLRAQKPVRNHVPENNLNIVGRAIMAFMIKPVGPSGPVPQKVERDTSAEYGKYLVMNVANCNGCHTVRGGMGEYIGEPLAGGNGAEDPKMVHLTPPNISGDPSSRIRAWKQEDFIKRFRMGKAYDESHMPWTAFANMSDDDLKAIYNYLKSVRANGVPTPQMTSRK
ncbi:c-type cytochrome [Pseudocnuella soli]|uniref:c-type cytochrome n=1 Tax=Pseudocnuella soli TaxID=2502779 RepID=UPI001045C0D6|nr:cytochrome c [Pseudocnuella soli]